MARPCSLGPGFLVKLTFALVSSLFFSSSCSLRLRFRWPLACSLHLRWPLGRTVHRPTITGVDLSGNGSWRYGIGDPFPWIPLEW